MPSFFKLSAGAAILSSATASAIGALPSQTIGGFGAPLFAEPTEAPKHELVRAKLAKKDVTNVCSEWTIPGGYGQPECFNSETCLFTSASDIWYEGCGQTSIAYDWITECYNYPKAKSSSPPVSQTYCPSTAPYCGYFAFIFAEDYTAWNFGCSTLPYSLFVDLLPTTTGDSTSTDLILGGGDSSSFIVTRASTNLILSQQSSGGQSTATVFVAPQATSGSTRPSATSDSSSSATTSAVPVIGSHSTSSTPIGAIVGGVVGGIAVIGFLAFLIWFFLRKRRQDKAAAQAHEAQIQANQANSAAAATSTAFNNHNRISEIGGTMKPPAPPANTYVPPPNIAGVYGEKPAATANTQEVYRPPGQEHNQSAYAENLQPHSPPPVYAQPQPASPPSHYNELEQQYGVGIARPMGAAPVSPMGTGTTQGVSPVNTPTPQQQYQHMSMASNTSELSGNHVQPQAQPQQSYSPRPGFQEMSSSNAAIPMRPAGAPPQMQEMNANPHAAVPMRPAGPPLGMQEMSGNTAAATGGVNRPAGSPPGVLRYDMNGNPMSEFHGAELE